MSEVYALLLLYTNIFNKLNYSVEMLHNKCYIYNYKYLTMLQNALKN